MDRKPIVLIEQQQLSSQDKEYVDSLNLDFTSETRGTIPPYLGLSPDGWCSYYVGASWLKEGHRPLIVHPKYDRINYISILSAALSDNVNPHYFQEAYSINVDTPPIEDKTLNTVLSPLLVAHFLSVIRLLLVSGLKRNYIIREENLTNKVRGHVMPLRNLQKNILQGHGERTWCRFQEYSYDYPENRLLKRGLLAAESLLVSLKVPNNALLQQVRRYLLPFHGISADISPLAVRNIRKDKLHGEYPEAIKLAKRILQRMDYSISDTSNQSCKVPEFAVDMSRIFEFYVLGLLKHYFISNHVLFQESAGIMGRCDYIVPSAKLIVDAKYKPNYTLRDSNTICIDVREVAGYSRSQRIRRLLNVHDHSEINCLIIYPNDVEENEFAISDDILSVAIPLKGVHNFYTLEVPIPLIK